MFIHSGRRSSPAIETEHKTGPVKLGKRTQELGGSESKCMEFQEWRELLALRQISLDFFWNTGHEPRGQLKKHIQIGPAWTDYGFKRRGLGF